MKKKINKNDASEFFPEVPEKLQELAKNFTLLLSTGNSTQFATQKLKSKGLDTLFTYILGSENILKSSNHITYFEEKLGDKYLPLSAIFIGDGEKDREIARFFDMPFIHIDETGKNPWNERYAISCIKDIDIPLQKISHENRKNFSKK